jgi:hypothetical protein
MQGCRHMHYWAALSALNWLVLMKKWSRDTGMRF